MKKLLRKINDWFFPHEKWTRREEWGYENLPEGKYSLEDVE